MNKIINFTAVLAVSGVAVVCNTIMNLLVLYISIATINKGVNFFKSIKNKLKK